MIRLVLKRGHVLKARHIPGKRNVWADQLSRPTKILATGVSTDHKTGVRSPDRSVCDISEQQAPSVLLTATREHVVGHGCDVAFMGRDVGVRLPPDRLHIGGITQNAGVRVRDATSSTSLAQAVVVPPPSVNVGRRATLATNQTEVDEAAQHQLLPSEPRNAPASRVEVIEQSLQGAGFSRTVSTHRARRNRASTNVVYEAKWRVYNCWCLERTINSCSPTLNQV